MDKNKNELQLIGYLKQNSASLIALYEMNRFKLPELLALIDGYADGIAEVLSLDGKFNELDALELARADIRKFIEVTYANGKLPDELLKGRLSKECTEKKNKNMEIMMSVPSLRTRQIFNWVRETTDK